VHLVDVRRSADRDASTEVLPGATWHYPEHLAQWADALPKDQPIVLYCVRGGSVSNSVVDALQARGLNACYIEGDNEIFRHAGARFVPGHGEPGPLVDFDQPTRDYLERLKRHADDAVAKGVDIEAAKTSFDAAAWKSLANFAELNGRNAYQAYQESEAESF